MQGRQQLGGGGDRVQSGPTGIVSKKCKKLGQEWAVLTRMGVVGGLGIVLRGVTCNVRTQETGLACDKVQKKGYGKQMPCLWGHT
jgi:hypothetical protein